jgi:hypothetical protein
VNLDANLLLIGWVSVLNVVGLNLAVLELDALGNLLQIVSGYVLIEIYVIDLLLQILRMCKLRSQIAIVGEQQHTSSVAVETTYGVDALWTCVLNEVHNSLTLLRIIASSYVVLWLVEQYVNLLLDFYGLIVELNQVGTQNLCSQLGYNLAVNRYYTCLDELVGLTTAANTCIGQELVQAQWLVWIVVDLLVLDALLHRVLCIWIIVGCTLAWSLLIGSCTIRFAIATLLRTTVATLLRSTVATLLWTTITTLLGTLTVAALLWTTIATLLWTTIATLLWTTVATLLWTLAIASLWALAITTLWALTVATLVVIVVTWAIASLRALGCIALQTCAESLRTELAFVIVIAIAIALV